MKVIRADHERLYELPGVREAARRPVDIDSSKTGFARLRSLRLYRFNAGTVIDGHAEEDEVFLVVTSGSVELKIGWEDSAADAAGTFTLADPHAPGGAPFVAYLPPHAVYQLTPHTQADVAYARATPQGGPAPAVFTADPSATQDGVITLLDERTYAQQLQLQVAFVQARDTPVTLDLPGVADANCEALVHVQCSPADSACSIAGAGAAPLQLQSWETASLDPGERAALHVAAEAAAFVLTVLVPVPRD